MKQVSMRKRIRAFKLSRPQKIARNILLVILIAAILFLESISGYSHSEEAALNEVLRRMGVPGETVFVKHDWHYEGKDMWGEVFLRSEWGVYPVVVNIKIYRYGPFRYAASYPDMMADVDTGRGIRSGSTFIYSPELRESDGGLEAGMYIYYGNVFDFPQLGSDNTMKLTCLGGGCWQVDVDCIGIVPHSFALNDEVEIRKLVNEAFEPELTYMVDSASGTVTWLKVSEESEKRGMTLNYEEAFELAKRMIERYKSNGGEII